MVPGMEQPPTVSVGVVSYPLDGQTVDELMISADQAMYASKRAGRNRVAGPTTGTDTDLDLPTVSAGGGGRSV
jgi:predicted signal transduction protein with EAL and GGDEF domain